MENLPSKLLNRKAKHGSPLQNPAATIATLSPETSMQMPTTPDGFPHHKKAPWSMPKGFRIMIKGEISTDGGKTYRSFKSGERIPKGAQLNFIPINPIMTDGKYYWQITNTGEEARAVGRLRGDDFECSNTQLDMRIEHSTYTGRHYLQCFYVDGNDCLACSKPFVVDIVD